MHISMQFAGLKSKFSFLKESNWKKCLHYHSSLYNVAFVTNNCKVLL